MCGASAKKQLFFNDKHSTHSFGLDRLYNMIFITVKKTIDKLVVHDIWKQRIRNLEGGPKVVTQTFGLIAQRFVAH